MTLLLPEVLQEEECVLFKVQRELGRKTGGETYSLFSSLDTPSPAVPSLVVPPLHLPTIMAEHAVGHGLFPLQAHVPHLNQRDQNHLHLWRPQEPGPQS